MSDDEESISGASNQHENEEDDVYQCRKCKELVKQSDFAAHKQKHRKKRPRPGAPSSVASSQLFTRHSPSPEPDDSQSLPPPRSPNRKSPRKKKTTTTFTAGTSVAARQEKAKKKYNKNKEKSQVNGRFPKVHGA